MSNEFKIGEHSFKVGKMNAFKQFHVVRRLAPILGDLIPIMQKLEKMPAAARDEAMLEMLSPALTGLSKLSDEETNKILLSLLECVHVQQGPAWAAVVLDGKLMFEQFDLPVLLQAAGKAFAHNLSGFFQGLPQSSSAPA